VLGLLNDQLVMGVAAISMDLTVAASWHIELFRTSAEVPPISAITVGCYLGNFKS
jgi:hypothetical protein